MEDELPEPRPIRSHPPFTDLSFAALGWLIRATRATGSVRHTECLSRAHFYLTRANWEAATPAEKTLIAYLFHSLEGLARDNSEAQELLKESCSKMDAADATEFIEMCEEAEIVE